jgi:GT2 family glycosyltransferase
MKPVQLSIIIVTFNHEKEILPCLNSIPWYNQSIEVWIIDNHSTDHTRKNIESYKKCYPNLKLYTIWNSYNYGYAAAVNQGIKNSLGKYICLLGPDARLLPGTLKSMRDYIRSHPEVGLIAPQIQDHKGHILPSCRRFPTYNDLFLELSGLPRLFPNKNKSTWKMSDFPHNSMRTVDQPEATCLLTHRTALSRIGWMDEQFSMFFNDVDWCRRYKKGGWKIVFLPEAKIIHQKGTSIRSHRIPMIWKSHQGFYRYFQKYAPSVGHRICNFILGFILIFTALLRSLLYGLRYSTDNSKFN